jgi:hypothetical protein
MMTIRAALLSLLVGGIVATGVLWAKWHVEDTQQCKDLSTQIDVWTKCVPQNGCIASYTETLQLVKRIHRCQEAIGAPKDSSPDSQ